MGSQVGCVDWPGMFLPLEFFAEPGRLSVFGRLAPQGERSESDKTGSDLRPAVGNGGEAHFQRQDPYRILCGAVEHCASQDVFFAASSSEDRGAAKKRAKVTTQMLPAVQARRASHR
jgi:hypothetical protein